MTTQDVSQRRVLVSYAAPEAFAPATRSLLARLGYAILTPEEFEEAGDEDARPDLYVVDERRLADVGHDGDGDRVPIVALTGRHGVTGADPRIAAALPRPAGVHDLYRVLQELLEDTPRLALRAATHLAARCRRGDECWRGVLLSLSENGALLRSPEPLGLGSRLALEFEPPGAGLLEVEAEVAYQLPPDHGVVFSAVPPRTREAIADWVRRFLSAS